MRYLEDYHHIECPFSRPGYFTGVVAIVDKEISLIDAGTVSSPQEKIYPFLKDLGRNVNDIKNVILTHSHGDHSDGLESLLQLSDVSIFVHALERPNLLDLTARMKLDPSNIVGVKHGDVLEVSDRKIEVFHSPGHSSGSICLVDKEVGLGVTGDSVQGLGVDRPLLFYSSIAYTNSMRRLSLEPLSTFMMGHPFPPFEKGVIKGKEVKNILVKSLEAVRELKEDIENILVEVGRPLTVEEIGSKLPEVRKQSIRPILEELVDDGRVSKLGRSSELLWLKKD